MKKNQKSAGCWRTVMKITTIQMLIALLLTGATWANSSAQEMLNKRITILTEKTDMKTVLHQISKTAQVRISYNSKVITNSEIPPLHIKNERLSDVLDQLLTPFQITYVVINQQIILRKTEPVPPNKSSQAENQDQHIERSISGIVTDEKGGPLPGVSVVIKGSQLGTTTGTDGKFILTLSEDNAVLVFSFVGYIKQEISTGRQTSLNISLLPENKSLNEVIVVGYGTVKKSDLTGSVVKVGESAIKSTPIVALDRAMQGRAAGVLVTQNSARPGGVATIRIRGTGSVNAGNDPLYVIDGFPIGNLNSINPNDIESIEVLKDASATAIYGSRGSNGVVMVTTKRGKAGQSAVDFESYYGVQSVRHDVPVLNARQYAEFINEARLNGGSQPYFDGSSPSRPLPSTLGEGTNWQKEVFTRAPIQNYQLSLTGGENKTRYSISASYYDQKGVIVNSYFKRYTLRANIDREVSSRIKVGLTMQGAFTKSNSARTETDGGAGSGITNATLNFSPTFPVFNPDGTYYRDQSTLNGNLTDNPVGLAREVTDQFYTSRVLTNIFADIRILDGLNFRTSWGGDLDNTKSNYYATRQIGLGAGTNGSASISTGFNINWLNENTLNYSKTFAQKHNFNALLGYTTQGYHTETVITNAINFNDDFAKFNNLGAGATFQRPYSGAGDWALISYLARINYGYSDRFLLTLTARRDGSSRFGTNNKYGYFPSGAVAWRLINEKFMQNQKLVSDLKLRVSYGLTGNQEIGDFRYAAFMANVAYPFGGPSAIIKSGSVPGGISNLDLSWEKNAQFDAGIDLSIVKNRIQLTADYYIKTTSDLLFEVNVPYTTGYGSSLQNIGRIENRGLEISLNTINIDEGNFKWNSEFNIAFNRNKVLNLDGRPEFTSGEGSGHLGVFNTVLMKVGNPLGDFYGRHVQGIFQNQAEIDASAQKSAKPGDLRYADINGDGTINDLDRTVIGNGNPKFFGGFNNTFTYKGFELNVFAQGSYGNDILNFGRFDLYNLNGNNNQAAEVVNRWTPENRDTNIPRANSVGGQRILSSFHIEDGSYLRIKNISLGYHLPQSVLKKIAARSVKIYIAAQNWVTFTKYKGYDPEVNRFGNAYTGAVSQGMDYGGYPSAKTLLVGLNVKF